MANCNPAGLRPEATRRHTGWVICRGRLQVQLLRTEPVYSVIGSSVWLTHSVDPHTTVLLEKAAAMVVLVAIVGIAVKAQHRLQRRYQHLARTKHTNKAVTAVARELCGFIWSVLWEVDSP